MFLLSGVVFRLLGLNSRRTGCVDAIVETGRCVGLRIEMEGMKWFLCCGLDQGHSFALESAFCE